MTKAAWRAAWSIWSRIESSVALATTVRVSGFPGRPAQRDTGLLGSASMIATVAPRPASSVARTTADVDFPAPPLGLAKTIVGMDGLPRVGLHHERRQLTNSARIDDRPMTDHKRHTVCNLITDC